MQQHLLMPVVADRKFVSHLCSSVSAPYHSMWCWRATFEPTVICRYLDSTVFKLTHRMTCTLIEGLSHGLFHPPPKFTVQWITSFLIHNYSSYSCHGDVPLWKNNTGEVFNVFLAVSKVMEQLKTRRRTSIM